MNYLFSCSNTTNKLIYEEIYRHSRYSDLNYPIAYRRTTSQIEIDFVLGDYEVTIEARSTVEAESRHLKGLKAFGEEKSIE
jgi:hypothetical protein